MTERPKPPWDADTVRESPSAPRAPRGNSERYFGPYRLLQHIGGGGMGVVYRAEDTRLGRIVALKLLPPELTRDPLAKTRFLQEARAASALDHPNVCAIYEVGETEDLQLYLVMPCYEGETLRERIDRGPMPIAEVLDIAGQIAQGLAKAHQRGIVHRDIKPANLMITADGLVKILDFGTAKLIGGAGLTRTGSVIGTPAYMSPEQMMGDEVDERTDLWSLGVVIYEMVTSKRPFRGDHETVLREAILRIIPEPIRQRRPEVPEELDRLVTGLLAKNPVTRMSSAASVARTLCTLAGGPSGTQLAWPPAAGARRVWFLGFCAASLVAVTLATVFRDQASTTIRPHSQAGTIVPAVARPEQRLSLLVLGFRDLTEESAQSWLGPAITEMLTTELAAGAKVRLMASERAAFARSSLDLASTESLDRTALNRLHVLAGTELAVVGSFLPLEGKGERTLRLDVRILTLPEGDTVTSVAEVGPESELFSLVGRIGERLRRALGISLPTEEQAREARRLLPAGSVAIRLYTEALVHLRAYEPGKARDLLVQAAQLDPKSPVIHSALAEAWGLLGNDAQARESAVRAFDLRGELPQEAQLAIEASRYKAERQWAKASEVYRSLWTFFPDDMEYGLQLASALMMEGRGPEGIALLEELRKRPGPEGDDPRIDLVAAQTAMRIADSPLQERAAAATAASARRLGAHLLLARALIFQSNALLRTGRAREALALTQQAERLAVREGDRWLTGMALSNLGRALYGLGRWHEAEQAHKKSQEIARDLGTERGIGRGAPLSRGDTPRSRGLGNGARAPGTIQGVVPEDG